MKKFGAALRKAREEAGITVRDIFERTRINPKYLQAIEEGNFPSLPQTYIRAFIRDYAREVGLDEESVLSQYNKIAEVSKGIVPPPPAVDTSALIPHLDDTIEIIQPEQESVKQVETIKQPSITPGVEISKPVEKIPLKIELQTETQEEKNVRQEQPATLIAVPTQPVEAKEKHEEKTVTQIPLSGEKEKSQTEHKGFLNLILSSDEQETKEKKKYRPKPGRPTRVYDTKPIPPSELPFEETIEKKPAKALPVEKRIPPKKSQNSIDSQRRKRVAAWLIIFIIVASIYGIIKFGNPEPQISGYPSLREKQQSDSARIAARLNANRFIDSTQLYTPEQYSPKQDTVTVPTPKEEKALEPVVQKFSAEDSLVLEAFSTSSVWFTIRMDTTRSERGSLSTNDHRVWKAKDRFILTLGDAGAVSFVLNGKDIGTLGEEGLVIKNYVITRDVMSRK